MIWKIYKKTLKIIAKQIPFSGLRVSILRLAGYTIGQSVYIGEDLIIIDELEDRGNVLIGDHVSIAPRVTIVISSYPNTSKLLGIVPISKGPVKISKNAWIGTGAIILPNVTVGEGSIVGAGAVVTKDIAPHTIVAGSPARALRELQIPHSKNRLLFEENKKIN